MTPNQQQLFEGVRKESRYRARLVLQVAKLKKDQKRKFRLAKQKLEQASIVLNLDLREQYHDEKVIDSLLSIGRVLNLIEIGNFPGGIHDQRFRTRLLIEFKLYGATCDVQLIFGRMHDSERPNYGVLDYLSKATSVTTLGYYGHYRLVLKNELKNRSTFTPLDSFLSELDQVYVWEDIEGVLTTKLGNKFWFEHIVAGTEPLSTAEGIHYIEAQILGGVHLSYIARLYYPAADQLDHDFFAKLKRLELEHGIELVHH